MLVLTRKIGQKLIIGDNIEITIVDARGDAIKLGINAPRDVKIYREEIYAEICKANKEANQHASSKVLDGILKNVPAGNSTIMSNSTMSPSILSQSKEPKKPKVTH